MPFGQREVEFEALAVSIDHPDWVGLAMHSYPMRWRPAARNPAYAPILAMIQPANKPSLFAACYQRVVLDGVGHFPRREAPAEVAAAVLGLLIG